MPDKTNKYFSPQPKPEPKPKSKSRREKKGKVVPKKDQEQEQEDKTPDQIALTEKITKRNNINRGFGRSIEREVSKRVGGVLIPASGAIKNSVLNLEGDVQVRSPDNKKTLMLIECKGTSTITPKGDKSFSLKKSVLDQIVKEAGLVGALPVLYLHWRQGNYDRDDYVIIPSANFYQLVEDMKELYTIERTETS
jgi:hypothetical protein